MQYLLQSCSRGGGGKQWRSARLSYKEPAIPTHISIPSPGRRGATRAPGQTGAGGADTGNNLVHGVGQQNVLVQSSQTKLLHFFAVPRSPQNAPTAYMPPLSDVPLHFLRQKYENACAKFLIFLHCPPPPPCTAPIPLICFLIENNCV